MLWRAVAVVKRKKRRRQQIIHRLRYTEPSWLPRHPALRLGRPFEDSALERFLGAVFALAQLTSDVMMLDVQIPEKSGVRWQAAGGRCVSDGRE